MESTTQHMVCQNTGDALHRGPDYLIRHEDAFEALVWALGAPSAFYILTSGLYHDDQWQYIHTLCSHCARKSTTSMRIYVIINLQHQDVWLSTLDRRACAPLM